jgi:hypothetical protein
VGAWSYFGNLIEAYSGDYPGGTLRFYVDQAGNIYTDGTYNTFGSSTLDGATHATASVQSTEAWLEDFSRARLVNGMVKVEISRLCRHGGYDTRMPRVPHPPLGDSQGLYITNLTPTSFEVHEQGGGTSASVSLPGFRERRTSACPRWKSPLPPRVSQKDFRPMHCS